MFANAHVLDVTHIHDLTIVADDAPVRCMLVTVKVDDGLHAFNQCRPVTVEGVNIGKVGRQLVVDMYFTAARFIQYVHLYAVAKSGRSVYQDHIYILYKTIVANRVVGNIVLHVLNDHVVADAAIVDDGIVDPGMFFQTAGELKPGLKDTETDLSLKLCVFYITGIKVFFHGHLSPVGAAASVFLKLIGFILC